MDANVLQNNDEVDLVLQTVARPVRGGSQNHNMEIFRCRELGRGNLEKVDKIYMLAEKNLKKSF